MLRNIKNYSWFCFCKTLFEFNGTCRTFKLDGNYKNLNFTII